jgi:hypothetical protein
MIDGRAYDTSETVKADIRDAGRTLNRLRIPAELETRPIGRTTTAHCCPAGARPARAWPTWSLMPTGRSKGASGPRGRSV